MKKTVITSMLVMGTFVGAALAAGPYAPPKAGVVGSMHDMNMIDAGNKDAEGRVCAFCHTPHHAIADPAGYPQPLWSHSYTDAAGANITPYQSPYYNLTVDDTLAGPSRLCMSCHDGVIAADQHYGEPGKNVLNSDDWGGRAIGKQVNGQYNFSNDHPIGFVYADAKTEADAKSGMENNIWGQENRFIAIDNVRSGKTIESVLYQGSIMTCATCHDVHNKENVENPIGGKNYFVYAPQDGSRLCLSCHNK